MWFAAWLFYLQCDYWSLIYFSHITAELNHGDSKSEVWRQDLNPFQRCLCFGLSYDISEAPSSVGQHPIWGHRYLTGDCQLFLRVRRGLGRNPTAEQGRELVASPSAGPHHTGLARDTQPCSLPSHPMPRASTDLPEGKHRSQNYKDEGSGGKPYEEGLRTLDLFSLEEAENRPHCSLQHSPGRDLFTLMISDRTWGNIMKLM